MTPSCYLAVFDWFCIVSLARLGLACLATLSQGVRDTWLLVLVPRQARGSSDDKLFHLHNRLFIPERSGQEIEADDNSLDKACLLVLSTILI